MPVKVLDHPLAQHLLAELRDKDTQPAAFRRCAKILTNLLILEATYGIRSVEKPVTTPLGPTVGRVLGQPLAVVPVLRAGLGMLEPAVELFPNVAVGYIGLERHHDTAVAHSYYKKLPHMEGCFTLCLDPMLATGGSASQALSFIKSNGATHVTMVSIVSAPEGIELLQSRHPDVPIVTAAIDECLNAQRYIVPGLGDFGDRLYGTF